MKLTNQARGLPLRTMVQFMVCAAVVAHLSARPAFAAAPLQPTLAPFYSFDGNSPTVLDGTFRASDILTLGPADDPVVVLQGSAFGLGQPGDELDGLSGPNSELDAALAFGVLFSMDRNSIGNTVPDPALVARGLPYNALDQAVKQQAAGDQCMSLDLFTRFGPVSGARSRVVDNNTLLRNNYNEGGTGFGGQPETSAAESAAARGEGPVAQDNVNSMFGTRVPTDPRGPANLQPFYFSAKSGSPSLPLPGATFSSGADIYFHGVVQDGQPPQSLLYASFTDLGLAQSDDISSVLIIDEQGDENFDPQDQVIFTLAPGSPSLMTLGGPGVELSSADLLSTDASGNPIVFVGAAGLGLAGTDSVSAIDFLECSNADSCVDLHAIRAPAVPAASTWGLVSMALLLVTAGSVIFIRRRIQTA